MAKTPEILSLEEIIKAVRKSRLHRVENPASEWDYYGHRSGQGRFTRPVEKADDRRKRRRRERKARRRGR